MRRTAASGALVRLLPRVFTRPGATPQVKCLALASWAPDAVLVAETAGFLRGWNDAPENIQAAVGGRRLTMEGYRFLRREIPPEFVSVVHGLRCTSAALTAIDLAIEAGADAIDDALRRGTTLASLWAALEGTSGRRGLDPVRRLLVDSRDEPWSAAERAAHRLLRAAGIRFRANYFVVAGGKEYFVDLALPGLRLAFEVDGHKFHSGREAFAYDRERDAELAAAGWQVVRFAASMPLEQPERFIALIVRTIRQRARLLGVTL